MNKNEKFVVTINREVGTGGRTVGRKLAHVVVMQHFTEEAIDAFVAELLNSQG